MYPYKNILVTGAAGFIGSNFVEFMLSTHDNISIVSLDALTYAGNINNLDAVKDYRNHILVQGDISDKLLVDRLMKQYNIDTIVHFAAESHVDNSIDGPEVFFTTNVMGTVNLLQSAKLFWEDAFALDAQKCRFHHISTDEVYGSLGPNDARFTEQSQYMPSSPYSASKASSDHAAYCFYKTYGLPVTISNCSNNFGPKQHAEKLIPVVIDACLKGKPVPMYGDGSNIRDWLYVVDHCQAIDLILQKGEVGETYNVGGDCEIDNLSLAKQICHLLDKLRPSTTPYESLISFVEDRKGHDWRYAIDCEKIKTELQWKPSSNFIGNLQKTVEYYVNKIRDKKQ